MQPIHDLTALSNLLNSLSSLVAVKKSLIQKSISSAFDSQDQFNLQGFCLDLKVEILDIISTLDSFCDFNSMSGAILPSSSDLSSHRPYVAVLERRVSELQEQFELYYLQTVDTQMDMNQSINDAEDKLVVSKSDCERLSKICRDQFDLLDHYQILLDKYSSLLVESAI